MRPCDAEHRPQRRERDEAEEVDARPVEVERFERVLLVALPVVPLAAVGDTVLPCDEDVEVGPPLLQRRHRLHEDREAAVGLHPAGDVGDHLVGGGEGAAVRHRDAVLAGRKERAVDALVENGDVGPEMLRKLAPLPAGGRGAPVHGGDVEQDRHVLQMRARRGVVVHRSEEVGVGAAGVVVPLVEDEVAGRGPELLDEERGTPP